MTEPSRPQPSDSPQSPLPPPSTGLGTEAEWQALETELDRSSPPGSAAAASSAASSAATSARSRGMGSKQFARVRRLDPASPIVMVETAFLASASSLIWLLNFYFPFPLFRLFFPIPIAIAYLRWGHRAAWMATLVSGLLLSVLMGPVRSLLFIMPFGFLGVLLGVLWRRGATWGTAIFIGGLLGAIGFFFRIALSSILLGEDLWSYSTAQVLELLEWLFVRLGLLIQPNLAMIQAAILIMVLLNFWVYTFVVHLIAWITLDRLGNPIPRPPKWVQVLMEYE